MRVAIIGSGPSATSKEVGQEIDSFDVVVRINQFRLRGYEACIGFKTSVWAIHPGQMNSGVMKALLEARSEYLDSPDFSILMMPRLNTDKIEAKFELLGNLFPQSKIEVLRDMRQKYKRLLGANPTTGLLTIEYMLQYHNEVSIHGFDVLLGQECPIDHYYPKNSDGMLNHNPALEKRWLKKLIEEGKVKII